MVQIILDAILLRLSNMVVSLFLTILLLLFGVSPAFAAFSFKITNVDTTTISTLDQTVSISLSITDLPSGDSYFRVALQKDNGTYFGYVMDNNGGWAPIQTLGGDCSGYYKISNTSTTSLTLKFKVGNDTVVDNGNYKLKAHRFTSTCKTYTEATNNSEYIIAVSVPTPTSSPSPSPITSSSPSSSATTSSSTFILSNIPSTIDSTETFNASINLSLSDKANTTFYLKGAFKRKDGTNYFGQTKVNGSWIKNNKTYSDQYKITTDSSGNWSGNLEIQPDIMDSGYEGAGEYIFKVGRYTEDGSLNWSNEVTVKINAQEIVLDDEGSDILGINEKRSNQNRQKNS